MKERSKTVIRYIFGRKFMNKFDKCDDNSTEQLKALKEELDEKTNRYECLSIFKWVVFVTFIIIGLAAGVVVPSNIYKLHKGLYSREGLDKMMNQYYGDKNVSDALTDELLIVAYEYNSQQPRFYSKYFTG